MYSSMVHAVEIAVNNITLENPYQLSTRSHRCVDKLLVKIIQLKSSKENDWNYLSSYLTADCRYPIILSSSKLRE